MANNKAGRVSGSVVQLSRTGMRARQSSEGWAGRPSRAIDGNTNGRYRSGSCSHTHRNRPSWWEVALGGTYKVTKVVVWNRSDCCGSRLRGVTVTVDGKRCGVLGSGRTSTVRCSLTGSKIKMQKNMDWLTLCEVQIWGSKAAGGVVHMHKHQAVRRRSVLKYTAAYGGRGGRAVDSYCSSGYINYWQVRSGSLVDRIRGRCSNGRWLRSCGGRGGGFWQGRTSSRAISIKYGRLIDKFNGRGGNGGRWATLNCGAGFKITGYKTRCGSLVDRVQLQCKSGV